MAKTTTAGLPALQFRPETPETTREQAAALVAALESGPAIIRANSSHGVRVVDATPTGPVLRFIGVSEGVKRDGSIVRIDGIDTKGLAQNPVFLWGHNYAIPPIGKIVRTNKADHMEFGRVMEIDVRPLATTEGTEHLDFASMIFGMFERGDMNAVSFGWVPVEMQAIIDDEGFWSGYDFLKSDALEFSAVTVPADPDALQAQIQRGVIPQKYVERFMARQDGETAAAYVLREVAPSEAPPQEETPAVEDPDGSIALAEARALLVALREATPEPERAPASVAEDLCEDCGFIAGAHLAGCAHAPEERKPAAVPVREPEAEPEALTLTQQVARALTPLIEDPEAEVETAIRAAVAGLAGGYSLQEIQTELREAAETVRAIRATLAGLSASAPCAHEYEPALRDAVTADGTAFRWSGLACRKCNRLEGLGREGQVLSRKNKTKLEKIMALAQEVLDDATKTDATETAAAVPQGDPALVDSIRSALSRLRTEAEPSSTELYNSIFRSTERLNAAARPSSPDGETD